MKQRGLDSNDSFGASIVPKLIGQDAEVGNFVTGIERSGGTSDLASLALIREIRGLPVDDASLDFELLVLLRERLAESNTSPFARTVARTSPSNSG